MIMPCINSTSAGDRGGSVARVEDGSVLLGAPGAPGCTTTGFATSACWAQAPKDNETTTAETLTRDGEREKIFIWTRTTSFHETQTFSKRRSRVPHASRLCETWGFATHGDTQGPKSEG